MNDCVASTRVGKIGAGTIIVPLLQSSGHTLLAHPQGQVLRHPRGPYGPAPTDVLGSDKRNRSKIAQFFFVKCTGLVHGGVLLLAPRTIKGPRMLDRNFRGPYGPALTDILGSEKIKIAQKSLNYLFKSTGLFHGDVSIGTRWSGRRCITLLTHTSLSS